MSYQSQDKQRNNVIEGIGQQILKKITGKSGIKYFIDNQHSEANKNS